MAKRKWEVQQTLEAHAGDVTACAFSNDTLATCSNDKTVRLWLYAAGTFTESAVSPLLGHKYGVNAVQFSPLGTALASCSTDGSLLLWNVESGEQLGQLQHRSQAALRCCSFSPSGALLATGGDDETLVLWDVATRSPVRSLGGVHAAVVASCSFSPDGALLASVSSAGDLRIWDARYNHAGCLVTRTDAHDLGATGVHFSPQFEATLVHDSLESSYLLASCGNDDLLRVWQVRMAQRLTLWPQWVLEGHNGSVMCCRFSPGGQLLASSGADKTSMVWDVGEEVPGQPLKPTFKMGVGEGVAAIGRWTAGQVGDWLDGLGLGEHREVFEANAIDGQELLHLTHEGLSAVLHVDAMGTRARLLREVQGLKHPLWRHLPGPGETSLPNELLCPITQQTMSDPVVAADGYSYERNAIQQWLANGKETSPMTGKPLEHKSLVANRTLQLLIQKYLR
ncbi:WD repeat, SAM and U-box domain-containing protein 1-like isoform X2 [Haemaphysalis longicornis]